MLTLVNRKHVKTQSGNHEVVKLKGIGGHTIMGFKFCKQKIQIGALSFTWDCCAVAMNDDTIIRLDFLEAHHGIVNLNNKTLSLNGCLVPTERSKDEESFARWISRVTLPSSQVIPPNTISNIPVTLEQSIPCGGRGYCVRAHNQWSRFATDVDDVVTLSRTCAPADIF